MSQQRMNNVMVLHIHKHLITDSVNLKDTLNDERRKHFELHELTILCSSIYYECKRNLFQIIRGRRNVGGVTSEVHSSTLVVVLLVSNT
jgi:hypothetical protein